MQNHLVIEMLKLELIAILALWIINVTDETIQLSWAVIWEACDWSFGGKPQWIWKYDLWLVLEKWSRRSVIVGVFDFLKYL